MKKMYMCGMVAVAMAVSPVVSSFGQQSTPSTPPPATDYTPSAPGTTEAGPGTEPPPAPAASIEPGQEIVAPSIRVERAPSAPFPAPSGRPAMPRDEQLRGGQAAIAGGQRGELGVWLVESGGPGVEIRRVTSGSAADQAGLQSGDVILQINGRGASSPHGVAQTIREMLAGQTAVVEFWRDGQSNELEIVLQPVREQYEVAFRGDDSLAEMSVMNRAGGDLESRTMRLEQQLAAVIQELRHLRQEMAQIRTSGSAPTAISGGGIGTTTTETTPDPFGQPAAGTATTTTGTTTTESATTAPAAAATPADPFGETATEPTTTPATEPAAEPATEPATEPAAEDDELFGSSTTEEPAATETESATEEATPAEGEAATEEAPAETESGSDDVFE
ncbi:MAG: PDZ domain-containing protein [Planctomycetes bacterium]|nr:PDZ domain-containing protein [Planctomycetota bacterium]